MPEAGNVTKKREPFSSGFRCLVRGTFCSWDSYSVSKLSIPITIWNYSMYEEKRSTSPRPRPLPILEVSFLHQLWRGSSAQQKLRATQSAAAQHLARKQKERRKWKDPTIPFEGTHPQIQIPFIRPRVLKRSAGRSSLYHKGFGFYSTFQPYQAHRFHTCRRKQRGEGIE